MKTSILLLATLGLTFSSLSAQTVPEFLNYQGTVTDSTGLGLGDSAPVNRKVLFRVYSAATAGALVWTEEQTVTISKGEFSVLLGQGIQFESELHDSLLNVFGEGATDRYLEITVDDGDGTLNGSDLAITPRQRITSTAYSFRAGTADSIASGSSLKLNSADSGLGYFDSSRLFGGISVDGPVLYGAGGGALGVDNGAGTQTAALRWDSGGDVGIGVTAPLAGQKLHVAGSSYFDGSVKIVSPTATALTIQSPTAGGYGLKHTNGASSLETWVSTGQANLQSTGSLNILAASTLSLFTNNSPRLTVNSTGNVGIGTTTPTSGAALEVNGRAQANTFSLPATSSSSVGAILQNGSSLMHSKGTNNIFVGQNAGNFTLSGAANTAIGSAALFSNTSGIENTANGYLTLSSNTTGRFNSAFGTRALRDNTTGEFNTALGREALMQLTTADATTAVGAYALHNLKTGEFNTAIGYNSLLATVSGNDNTAVGYHTLMDNTTGGSSTAVGSFALGNNSSGFGNTAVGSGALITNTAASNNTAVGIQALYNATGTRNTAVGGYAGILIGPGNNNTSVGYMAYPTSSTYSNTTSIGADSRATQSNMIRLGDSNITLIQGQVGFTSSSDRNLKENFEPVDGAEVVRKILDLNLTSWNFIGHDKTKFRHYGPMAQDFFAAFGHDAVGTIGSDTTINSNDLSGILLSAVQELARKLEVKNAELSAVQKRLTALEAKDIARDARLAAIEQLLSTK